MQLIQSSFSLFALSSLFLLSSSLPFIPRDVALEPLVPRARYSVVAVDGGAGGANSPAAVTTIIQTAAPTTQTVIETDTLPPVTNLIVMTKTIEGPENTKTRVITITPSAPTATATKYSIIDVSSPVTVEVPAPPPSVSQPSSSPAPSTLSTSLSAVSPDFAIIPPSSSPSAALPSLSSTTSIIISSPTASPSTISTTPSATSAGAISFTTYKSKFPLGTQAYTSSTVPALPSTTSYDNGQWHTTYPSWSNTTWTQTAVRKQAQTTSLV